ncbi:MAG: PAS domain-containing protein [Erythrobacter sp.]
MNTDDESERVPSPQANIRFDDAPERFRLRSKDDQFDGASGVLFEQAMAQTRMAICLCDPHTEDVPIVFANRAFRHLTGYSEDEIVGRNCRFLQGSGTDPEAVARIRQAIVDEDVTVVELLNYRKNGTSFWNALHLGPIYNSDGELIYFFGSQWDVSDVRAARAEERHAREMARELSHRMKNMFSVISSIVNVTGRERGIRTEAAEINSRIQALGRAYETTLDDASSGSIEIGEAIRAVLEPYERQNGSLELDGNGARMPFTTVSTVGLVLHELAANAIKHGAWSTEDGLVRVEWKPLDGEERKLVIKWIETGGPAVDESSLSDGTGTAIVDRMLRSAGGTINREWREDGLSATIEIPAGNIGK